MRAMPLAIEHIRRMRGGAQPHLLRCSDGGYYVVKFLNNPQHRRILANELLAGRLAARLGLPVPPVAIVEVPRELIEVAGDLVIQLARSRQPCLPGRHFGSRYPGDPADVAVYDFLPDELLLEVENRQDFWGMLVFDKWTCNTDSRQVVFYRPAGSGRFRALMVDQGFCFNAQEWNFPDAPLRGLYARSCVYRGVQGMEAFAPWLERLERLDAAILGEIAEEIPPEWYEDDREGLERLLEQLLRRRQRVPELIRQARDTYRQPFPEWQE